VISTERYRPFDAELELECDLFLPLLDEAETELLDTALPRECADDPTLDFVPCCPSSGTNRSVMVPFSRWWTSRHMPVGGGTALRSKVRIIMSLAG
jgi:hypothetical protein